MSRTLSALGSAHISTPKRKGQLEYFAMDANIKWRGGRHSFVFPFQGCDGVSDELLTHSAEERGKGDGIPQLVTSTRISSSTLELLKQEILEDFSG